MTCRQAMTAEQRLSARLIESTLHALEALHDMAQPVDCLSAVRAALDPHGVVIVADERVAELSRTWQ